MKPLRFFAFALIVVTALAAAGIAQTETYTGTVLSYGSGRNTRTTNRSFTLNITGVTSNSDVDRAISILQEGGQDDLLKAIRKNELGNFSVGGQLGNQLIGVRIEEADGKKRIRAIFERWINFSEVRGGYRSADYPFGYLELLVDPVTGKGDGTFLEAAKIRWKRDKKSDQYVVEIEDFGTFPARLMGISQRNRK